MHRLVLTVLFSVAAASGVACADVYTWTDAKGFLNVSNLAPPDGARVDKVVHDVAPAVAPPPAPVLMPVADPVAQAEVQTLAMRVRQLEAEVDFARRQPPAVMEYAPNPPPPVQYAAEFMPQPGYGCDQAWNGCGNWFGSYPVGVVVLGAPAFRHRPFPGRGFHRSPMLPMRGQTPARSSFAPRWH